MTNCGRRPLQRMCGSWIPLTVHLLLESRICDWWVVDLVDRGLLYMSFFGWGVLTSPSNNWLEMMVMMMMMINLCFFCDGLYWGHDSHKPCWWARKINSKSKICQFFLLERCIPQGFEWMDISFQWLRSCLVGGFKYVYFHLYFGEDFQFDDQIFQNGLVQPPTSCWWRFGRWFISFWSLGQAGLQTAIPGFQNSRT